MFEDKKNREIIVILFNVHDILLGVNYKEPTDLLQMRPMC